ncbi:MAG: hypothetical protein CVU39_24250 [Chloroflexi bacterium HGW-Chloroflexi-10]|nr:MAG: hypothetical protein CVU39_24250 [Chloroflexi bacterium HGW-Chloroflexi-10]
MDNFIYCALKFKMIFLRGALWLALLALCGCRNNPGFSITFGGDIILSREGEALFSRDPWGVATQINRLDGNFGSENLFFANLESPLFKTGEWKKVEPAGYDLCADDSQMVILLAGDLDLVSIANNHQWDCGDEDGENTRKILLEQSVQSVGVGLSPVFFDTKSGRVGIIAAEDVTQTINMQELVDQIKLVRQQCDYLIISMHWGMEYQIGASERQRELAQSIADAGADVLWGHHPHVLQPIEWVSSSTENKKMLVMYSLGNLLADQWMTQDTQLSALITLNFSQGDIVSIAMLPILMDRATKTLKIPDTDASDMIWDRIGLKELSGIEVIPLTSYP